MKKTKLLILSSTIGRGGADKQILNLGNCLSKEEYDIKIVSLSVLGEMGLQGIKQGIDVSSINLKDSKIFVFGRIFGFIKIFILLLVWKPQILLTFMFHATIIGRVTKMLFMVPYHISSVRSVNMGSRKREVIFKYTAMFDDIATVNSINTADILIKRNILNQRKSKVIPNGINAKQYFHKDNNRNNKEIHWIIIARMVPAKDYDTLLEAVRLTVKSHPEFNLKVIGEGKLFHKTQIKARKLGVNKNINFIGGRNDIIHQLSASDAFVFSSAWEGMPNVIMEALASSLPIVSTNVGGIPELVIEGRSGFLVNPGNPQELSDAIIKVINLTRKGRLEMGRYGKRYISEKYSVEKSVKIWDKLFHKLIES